MVQSSQILLIYRISYTAWTYIWGMLMEAIFWENPPANIAALHENMRLRNKATVFDNLRARY